jgi:hypothetical protein
VNPLIELLGHDTMSTTVYAIARWSEVFETADSRKYKSLPWISERTDFDSTGWQQGLDAFGPVEWPRVYGNWMILLRTAARAKVRGQLSGEKGEAWTITRIARPSGVDSDGMKVAFDFAVKIGWLIPVDHSTGESSDNLRTRPEISATTERNGTEQNETLRNGTERDSAESQPCRAGSFENSEAQETQITNHKSQISNAADRPESVSLAARSRSLPLLKDLGNLPLEGTGIPWHGSVFRDDRLKAHHITEAPAAFFIKWYLDQLTATRPIFKNGNRGQLCFVLAALYAVRRCTAASLSGTTRIARWCHWVRTFETNQITNADFARAAKEIASHFDSPPKAAAAERPAAGSSEYTPDPDVLEKRKNKVAELQKKLRSRST